MITPPTMTYIKTPYYETTAFSNEAAAVQANYLKAVQHFTRTVTTETIAQKFARLATNWKQDTKLSSSSYPLLMNPSYLGVIAMGEKALPFIFEDLKGNPDHWFMALAILTGANPVPEQKRGNVVAMAEAWVNWGKERGYVA